MFLFDPLWGFVRTLVSRRQTRGQNTIQIEDVPNIEPAFFAKIGEA